MASKPAARQAELTAHGGSVTEGLSSVLVNGRPAVRLSDDHRCPVLVPVVHLGGPVRFGGEAALTVLIGRKPAATIGGKAECKNSFGDAIAAGSENVFYQSSSSLAGLPVTEDFDGTLHVGKSIVLKGEPTWTAEVLGDLVKIGSTKTGQRRLTALDASGRTVTIEPYDGTLRHRNAFCAAVDDKAAQNGRGSDSVVKYDPDFYPPGPGAPPTTTGATRDVILFHELGHAEHNAAGSKSMTKRNDDYDNQEEYNTIEPDENDYRAERGFPPRHTHRYV
jgi:uncharacterized Zn-binding protein involved in type VI secretion